jgi:hypothetical protein
VATNAHVGRIFFYVDPVVSKENRLLVLLRTSCLSTAAVIELLVRSITEKNYIKIGSKSDRLRTGMFLYVVTSRVALAFIWPVRQWIP